MLLLALLPLALPTGHTTWASPGGLHHFPAALCSAYTNTRPRPRPRAISVRPHQRTSSTRPLSTPAAASGLVRALRRGSQRCKARCESDGRALRERESRCVLVLPASSPWPPASAFSRPLQLLGLPRGRDNELTRALRTQGSPAQRVEGRVERCRSWRSTSSGSSRSLYVPPAYSSRATGSSEHSCASVSCALTSFTLRAGQSSPRWHPPPFASRKLALFACRPPLDGAGRCSSCLSREDSGPGCRKMSVSSALLVPAAERVEPSWTGPTEAAPALSCP